MADTFSILFSYFFDTFSLHFFDSFLILFAFCKTFFGSFFLRHLIHFRYFFKTFSTLLGKSVEKVSKKYRKSVKKVMKWNSKSVEKVLKKYQKSVQKVLKMQNVFLAEIPFSCRHGICKVLPKDMRPFSDRRHCQTKVPDTFADLGPRSGQLVSEVWRFGPKVWALLP